MRPVSQAILIVIIAALCGLSVWQWWRESRLRQIDVQQRKDIAGLTTARDELESRVKNADIEILRLTGTISDLRVNSVSRETLEEQKQLSQKQDGMVEKQNALLLQQKDILTKQGEAIATQNTAIQQANDTIKKLAEERDKLVKKLNEVTALYNKLSQTPKPGPAQ